MEISSETDDVTADLDDASVDTHTTCSKSTSNQLPSPGAQSMDPIKILAPVFNLFIGETHSFKYQRKLKKLSRKVSSPSAIIRSAIADMPPELLHGRRGQFEDIGAIKMALHEKMPKLSGPMQLYIF